MNHNYVNMSLEDLVNDKVYIDWVRKDLQESEWHTWIEAQNEEVRDKFRIARTMIISLSDAPNVDNMNTQAIERLWKRIDATIANKSKSSQQPQKEEVVAGTRIIKLLAPIISIAAAVTLIVFFINRNADTTQYHTAEDLPVAISLPAASTIKLHPNSDVQYDKKNWAEFRTIQLDGTAEFDVTKGVPFRVETDLGSVEVLGTSFTVKEANKTFAVSVNRGRVAVKSGPDEEILTKGMAYLTNPSAADREAMSGSTYSFLRYDNVEIADVLDSIADYYQVVFEGREDEMQRKVSVFYDTEDLEQALDKVLFAVNWKYEIKGNTVILI